MKVMNRLPFKYLPIQRNFAHHNHLDRVSAVPTHLKFIYLDSHNSDVRLHIRNQSHYFIVTLGACIGAIIALAIGFQMRNSMSLIFIISIAPLLVSYILREVYVHTLIQIQHPKLMH